MVTMPTQDLDGMVDDYEYYPNNFTYNEHPEGVFWKYLEIFKPGIAYLHNCLPERSDYNDPYNIYVALETLLFILADLPIELICWWTVAKNSNLSKSVKWFLLIDTGLRLYGNIYGFFIIQCMLNWSCVDERGYPFSWLLLNQILSCISCAMDYISQGLALGLSTNRFFAIFFNGLHYGRVEPFTLPYIGIVFLIFGGYHLSMVGRRKSSLTGTYIYVGYFYSPLMYLTTVTNWYYPLAYDIIFNLVYVGYAMVGTSFLLDLMTFWRIRRMKRLSSNTKSRADLKLAVMVITTHLFSVLQTLYFQLNTLFLDSSIEPLTLNLVNAPSGFFPIISGATIAAFNYPFKTKQKPNRVINQERIPKVSHGTATQSTTVTGETQ